MLIYHSLYKRLFAVATMVLHAVSAGTMDSRCVMYLTGSRLTRDADQKRQHVVVPSQELTHPITHVILAFLRSDVFLADNPPDEYPLFMTIDQVRAQFEDSTKVTVAIGGWGDDGFERAARNAASRERWAAQVVQMVEVTGADGIDIDWEYPGGNRDDYKKIPNSEREWEIEAYVELLRHLREALGPDKLLTIAVPGQEVDLMAFTHATVPRILEAVDFINVMTYDLMNRRATSVMHHSGVDASRASVQRYIDRGAPPSALNLGLGYYVKWFLTEPGCDAAHPVGCPTQLMEDPETGDDLGRTGGFSWHDQIPPDVKASFTRAKELGVYDVDGSYGYWDESELRWWSFDTPTVVESKMDELVMGMKLGGVFAWGLGEDAPDFEHLKATTDGLKKSRRHCSDENNRDEL